MSIQYDRVAAHKVKGIRESAQVLHIKWSKEKVTSNDTWVSVYGFTNDLGKEYRGTSLI